VADEQNVWALTDVNINDVQTASIDRLISRCKGAHYVNIHIRINGMWEIHEGDWLKHLKRVVAPVDQSQLMRFYDVRTQDELIDRLCKHIDRLQAKLPQEPMRAEEYPTCYRGG
jgi:formamidopyrimidine-DNA glycosylase